MRSFDVIVIGAGPAGEVAAGRLGEADLEVALVESHLVGGECSFYACMPSKALLRPPEALAEAKRVPGAAEAVTKPVDVQVTLDRRDEVIHLLDDSSQLPWLEDRGVTLIRGRAKFTGERKLQVGDEEIEARTAVILANGSGAALPPIDGLKEADPWTNREVTTARAPLPERLLVMGGGVVGVEMAQAYQQLGCQVTLVEGERRLLPREEEFACAQVTEALEALGVDIRTGRKATKVERPEPRGPVTLTLDDDSTVTGDELLVAVGRRPATHDLDLEAIGLESGKAVTADEHFQVDGRPWLYSIGDVNEKVLLTHMGKYQARIASDHILGTDSALEHGADGPLAPRVIFTDPQVAAVGHTSKSAADAGLDIETRETGTSANAGGSFWGHDAPGTAQILIDKAKGTIVGATFTGAEVQDMLHAATVAIVGEVPVERLKHAVPCFPTRSEVWLALIDP